jgi:PAS domain S-box-containing protein
LRNILSRIDTPAYIIALIGIVFAVVAHLAILEYGKTKFSLDFEHNASQRFAAVENRITNELAIVNTLVAYITLHTDFDRRDFDRLIQISGRDMKDHAYQALEWVPRVPVKQIDFYEAAARRDGFVDYQFRQQFAGKKMGPVTRERSEYFPVFYIYPYVGNEGALGFDLGSNPARLKALEQARDNNTSVASARINLVQSPKDLAGILIFSPVFRNNTDISTVTLRRGNLLGFAIGVFRISRMVDTALNSSAASKKVRDPAGVDFYLFDSGSENKHELIYQHSSRVRKDKAPKLDYEAATQNIFFSQDLVVGGRTWKFVARPTEIRLATNWYTAAAGASLAILAISLLTAVFFTTISRQNQQVRILVDQRTGELKEASQRALVSEARVRAVVETVVDGIITFDDQGVIESINPAATEIFDYDRANLIGTRMWGLLSQPWCDEYEEYLRIYRSAGDITIIGAGREIQGLRSSGDEFPLDIGINEMKIAGQRKFTCVVRDITEQKLADKMKSEFVSTVSHELRTPLTSIKGALGLVRSGIVGELPEKLTAMLEIAFKNSERLVLLINDILNIEKIEAGKMDFNMVDLDLGQLVEEATKAHEAYAAEHNVRIDLLIPDGPMKVFGDHARLMQVLANLLSNAAKFSGDSDTVEVRLDPKGNAWRVSVIDHGTGIPEEFRDRIFQRFSQADSSDTRQIGGTGLGLSICQAIITNHDGVIDFASEPGHGTTFYFELPALSPSPASEDRGIARDRILVCEDDRDVSRILTAMLHNDGFSTDTAFTAAEAKGKLKDHIYVAMTLDLELPDQDGISLLRDIRAEDHTKSLPVIVVSASAEENAVLQNGNSVNVVDWIAKPVDTAILTAAINRGVRKVATEKPRVLHVEDDKDVSVILSALATDFCDCVAAASVASARSLLQQQSFDLVILDLALPDGSGEDLLPLLSGQSGTPTPVIIFSAKETTRELAENVMAVLVKSQTTNEDLLATVRAAISAGVSEQEG